MANDRSSRVPEASPEALAVQQQAVFSAMTEMIVLHQVIFDQEGKPVDYRITDCNSAFSKITGISRDAAIGRLASEVYQVRPAPYLEVYSETGMTGTPTQFETYFPPMDKYFMISVVSHAPNCFATITTDITDIKRLQLQVEGKNRELEQIVYIASHDLRSPLVNVDGYSRELAFALDDLETILGEDTPRTDQAVSKIRGTVLEMREALRYIRNSTAQMDALLKGLLKLSRSGRAALTLAPLDMNALMEKVLASFAWQIKEAGVRVTVNTLPPCKADGVQLTEVFSNLISNAIKYFSPARPGSITISGISENGRSTYIVEDNGIGIAKHHQANIFEMFHRLDPAATPGDGMGLTLVRQILTRLDGNIRVESEPDKGSRFYVELPAAILKQKE